MPLGKYVICKEPEAPERLVRVLHLETSAALFDYFVYEVEDVVTGEIFIVSDDYLRLWQQFNEMEILAWVSQ